MTIFATLFCVLLSAVFASAQDVSTNSLENDSAFFEVEAQDTISVTKKEKLHSPKRALIYEALVPGLGHIYNKKAWHIPITYVAFGTSAYFIIDNTKKYRKYRDAYADFSEYAKYLGQRPQYPFPIKEPKSQRFREVRDFDFEKFNDKQLESYKNALKNSKDRFRRYRDLSYISLAGLYILNLVWVTTDAHFFYYDVSDDLSLQIQPQMYVLEDYKQAVGVNLVLNF